MSATIQNRLRWPSPLLKHSGTQQVNQARQEHISFILVGVGLVLLPSFNTFTKSRLPYPAYGMTGSVSSSSTHNEDMFVLSTSIEYRQRSDRNNSPASDSCKPNLSSQAKQITI